MSFVDYFLLGIKLCYKVSATEGMYYGLKIVLEIKQNV